MICSGMYTHIPWRNQEDFKITVRLKYRKVTNKMWGLSWLKDVRNNYLGDLTWKKSLPDDPERQTSQAEGEPTAAGVQHTEEKGEALTPRQEFELHSNRKRFPIMEHLIKWCFKRNISDINDRKKPTSKTRSPEDQLGSTATVQAGNYTGQNQAKRGKSRLTWETQFICHILEEKKN